MWKFDCFGLVLIFSKLHCLHFSSWDSSKEWIVDMPPNEDIEAVCLGQGWAAAATSSLLLRLFTIGGVQKEVFSLPGPVVSMAGHGEQLIIVYHRGRLVLIFCNFTRTWSKMEITWVFVFFFSSSLFFFFGGSLLWGLF